MGHDQAAAERLADSLLEAGLDDDVIALSRERWQQWKGDSDLLWRGICRAAVGLLSGCSRPGRGFRAVTPRLESWLKQVENDLAMAEYAHHGCFHAQTCYHCSQAAEKALKGLLIGLGEEPPRSHSLERLVDAVAEAGLPVETWRH